MGKEKREGKRKMNAIRVIHCADVHIGAELSSLGSHAGQRREEVFGTFENIVSRCREEKIQLLLISGDLFESSGIDKNYVDSVKQTLKKIPDTIVAISPGNHDYISVDSPYLENGWPENVHIFKSGLEYMEFRDLGLRLWGAAFTGSYCDESMLKPVKIPDDNFINICIMHGDLVTENQTSRYNPITARQIGTSGMDYIALGHIHKRTEILSAGSTYYAYCGCPEGQGFDELDAKGIYQGTVGKGHCALEFCPVCKRMNLEISVDIGGVSSCSEIPGKILSALKQQYGASYPDHLYHVILDGSIDPALRLDCAAITARMESQTYFMKISDHTRPAVNLDALAEELSLKGIFTRRMKEKIAHASGSDREKYERAWQLGIKAFDGEVAYHED
jgi:DNA repair exonuclease SbcCD nuclease subunit